MRPCGQSCVLETWAGGSPAVNNTALQRSLLPSPLKSAMMRVNARIRGGSRWAHQRLPVLAADDGEHLLNASGEVVIKLDPGQGSQHLSLGTQHVPQGAGIPRHRHAYWDEFIYVLDGSGTATLNDQMVPIQKGATIFIPTGTWHGFENPGTDLFILWATTPTGQEEFFRAISSRPGEPPKNLTPEQVGAIRKQVEADHLKRIEGVRNV